MKKIRLIFMFATFCVAIGGALAFTPKHKAACIKAQSCNALGTYVEWSGAEPLCDRPMDVTTDCKLDEFNEPCDEVIGCVPSSPNK